MTNVAHTILPIILLLASSPASGQHLAAGGRHSMAICADSTVEAWGYNGYGQMGNGNTSEQHSGTPVTGLDGIIQVAGGLFHSLFVKSDGTAWSCGRNPLGNLGDGTNADKAVPVQVQGLTDIVEAAGGGEHSLFRKRDGTVWACGNNSSGQLGDGTNASRNIPVRVIGLSDIVQVAAGAEFSLFLKADGTVWVCGHNGFGQYGNGSQTSSKIPVQVGGLTDIVQLSAGEWHSLFVKNDGTVLSSGRNQYGQLGDGTTVDRYTAAPIPGLTGVVQAEAGGIHSLFLRDDGTAWACGLNSGGNNDGQLGDGTATDRHSPVQVIPSWGSDPIIRVEATREHSLFLVSGGAVWAAGRNNYGQLGYGAFTPMNSLAPVLSHAVCNTLPTSLNVEPEGLDEMQIFPNPGDGTFFVKPGKEISRLEIINILGSKVNTYPGLSAGDLLEIDLSGHPKGVYFLKAVDAKNQVMTKAIRLQ